MILDVISHLDEMLMSNADITSQLSIYQGSPAIAFQVAPEDMKMPYIVTSSASNRADANYVTDSMLYNVDIYVQNKNITKASEIAKKVIEMFHMIRLPVDVGLNMWKDLDLFIPEEDPSVVRYHIQFGLRHI